MTNEEGEIMAFVSPAAYARFLADFGWLIEAHHRYQLYDPSSRRATRQIVAAFEKCVSPSAVPAIANVMKTIIQDIDDQESFEKQQYEEDQLRNIEKSQPEQDNIRTSNSEDTSSDLPENKNVVDAGNPFDDFLFPMTSRQRLKFNAQVSIIASACVLVSVYKSGDWGLQPAQVAMIQVPSMIYAVIFAFAVRASTVKNWLEHQFEGKGLLPMSVVFHFERFIGLVRRRKLTSIAEQNIFFPLVCFDPNSLPFAFFEDTFPLTRESNITLHFVNRKPGATSRFS